MMECRGITWPVHYEILAREIPMFANPDRWPEDRVSSQHYSFIHCGIHSLIMLSPQEGRVIRCTMNSHDPMRLGYCLRFMYDKGE